MNIELTGGKEIEITDLISERIELKLSKIESRFGQKLFFRVRFDKEGGESYTCQVHFNGKGTEFNASATEDDLIKSADQAISKIERQLKKFQSKKTPRGGLSIRDTVDFEPEMSGLGDLDL
jgi:ribosomal subunit interface protein